MLLLFFSTVSIVGETASRSIFPIVFLFKLASSASCSCERFLLILSVFIFKHIFLFIMTIIICIKNIIVGENMCVDYENFISQFILH